MIDLDPDSRTYKILDWIDTTARAMPPYTQILSLMVVLGASFVFSLWLTHVIPYLVVGVW
jgi:hypothetical protein